MKRCLLALLLAVLLLSGCSSSVPEPAASEPAAIEPTTSPTLSPTPEPTPEPTAEPVTAPETAVSLAAPYLLPGQDDAAVRVCWTGARHAEGMCVLYGPAEADGSLPSEPAAAAAEASELDIDCFSADAMQYTAELAVAPGTRYAYAVVTAGGTPDAVYHFRTNAPDRLRAVAVSDTHLYSARAHEYHPAILEATLESALEKSTAAHEPIDMIVHTGDILDYPEYSLDMFFEGVPMLRSFLLAPVSGNHDSLYAVRRRLPMAGQDARTGNYWFVRAGVLFIGVQIGDRYFPNHTDFMASVAESAPEHNWTVLLVHYGLRSNGVHGHDAPVIGFRDTLEPMMDALDVDLVISGHDHEYNRTALLGGDAPEADTASILYEQPGERIYITLPSGTGLKYYDDSRSADFPFTAEGLEHEPGYVFFDFSPEEISLSAYSAATGEEIDAVTLRRGAPITEEE